MWRDKETQEASESNRSQRQEMVNISFGSHFSVYSLSSFFSVQGENIFQDLPTDVDISGTPSSQETGEVWLLEFKELLPEGHVSDPDDDFDSNYLGIRVAAKEFSDDPVEAQQMMLEWFADMCAYLSAGNDERSEDGGNASKDANDQH